MLQKACAQMGRVTLTGRQVELLHATKEYIHAIKEYIHTIENIKNRYLIEVGNTTSIVGNLS